MDAFQAYVPMDRLHAMLAGETLSQRVEGTALFADISGFTPLTEMLVRDLGPQRGAEELLVFLDKVYEPLIDQVGAYQGSVIGFSGDAITCWFDGDQGYRAVACAAAMQKDSVAFNALTTSSGRSVSIGLKVAVASGKARRFLVGYPDIQLLEVLAGTPLVQLASAEHQAARGEIVLDGSTADALDGKIDILEWREDVDTGNRFAVVNGLKKALEPQPWPPIQPGSIDRETVRPWLLPPVYQRLASGGGEFLAELRPAVTLFLRFGGIDYDNDPLAGEKLDSYIRQVQKIVSQYEGSLIQLTIGDKGSYLCASFGAPIAHEDDTRRAVMAGLEFSRLSPAPDWRGKIQIGISEGRMRTGAYGSRSRRTYGVHGPQTNLAARLMQKAAPGQILASPVVHQSTSDAFAWTELPPVQLKGVAEPLPVFTVSQERLRPSIHLQEPRYSLPMIGRKSELAMIEERIDETLSSRGQIVMITAEAGMGKSRLMAEAIRISSERSLLGYGGECSSFGTNTSYHLWHSVWRSFFGLHPGLSSEETAAELEKRLAEIDPVFVQRFPLLGPVLNLPLEDNDLTQSLDVERRKILLENMLVVCVRERARQTPLVIVLENVHWSDSLSAELIHVLARSIANLPVLILIASRSFGPGEGLVEQMQGLPYFTFVKLSEFNVEETEQLIRLKLEQIMGVQSVLPAWLVQEISRRSQGNPFYIEELLNFLRDKKINPKDTHALEKVDLPRSLQSLILSRIDQRTESQKITLKVASVIGRVFIAAWLWGAYPELGDPATIRKDLEVLSSLELTPLERNDPELTYLFKHIVTMEVAYDSLPYATRALLHDQVGQFIERTMPGEIDQFIDLLAFHYAQSNNEPKKREYLLKAGSAAQANFANQAAISYYQSLLPLLEGLEKVEVMLRLGHVLELVGQWDEAESFYQSGLETGTGLGDLQLQARCQVSMGELQRKRGVYQEAADWFKKARAGFDSVGDPSGAGQVLHFAGTLAAQQGDYSEARRHYEESLSVRRNLGDQVNIANVLNNLGILARYENDNAQARELYLESLAIRREIGDRWGISVSLNNLGIHAMDQNELADARTYLEEAITLQREIGDQYYLANYLNNLGNVARAQGDYDYASDLYCESLDINRGLGDGWQTAYILEDMGGLSTLVGDPQRAVRLIAAASSLREQINAPLPPHEQSRVNEFLKRTRALLEQSHWDAAWTEGRALSMDQAIDFAICVPSVMVA